MKKLKTALRFRAALVNYNAARFIWKTEEPGAPCDSSARELTEEDVDVSLIGNGRTIGVFSVKPGENIVVNPSVDINNHDGETDIIDDVKNVYDAMKRAGMFPYIEASAGKLEDGAHVAVICKKSNSTNIGFNRIEVRN